MQVKDVDTWNKIVREGEGFIYNDFGTQFPGDSPTFNTRDNNKLHSASCRHVKRMTYVSDGRLTKHFFQSRKEALDWLEVNRKVQGYTLCATCNP